MRNEMRQKQIQVFLIYPRRTYRYDSPTFRHFISPSLVLDSLCPAHMPDFLFPQAFSGLPALCTDSPYLQETDHLVYAADLHIIQVVPEAVHLIRNLELDAA